MKILSSEQTQEIDKLTIKEDAISSIDLMERASLAFVNLFKSQFPKQDAVYIFCGPGNNGGDGLAIARLLNELGYTVTVYLLQFSENYTQDYITNKSRLQELPITIKNIDSNTEILPNLSSGIILDAIFGSGLNKPLRGLPLKIVEWINAQHLTTVSVDTPSGLFSNQTTQGTAVEADYVYSFQLPKLAFLLPENEKFIKQWVLVDIGLSEQAISDATTECYYLTPSDAKQLLKSRNQFSHKGTFGHLLLVAGSPGKMGASILAGKAALRSGTGLLTMFVPSDWVHVVQTALPEAMCWMEGKKALFQKIKENTYSAIAIGPGIGQSEKTIEFFQDLIRHINTPLVLDADGLNILSLHPSLLNDLPTDTILTPHPGEFKRLVGNWENDFQKLKILQEFAINFQVIVVLKGAYTCICNSDGTLFFNSTGNNGMATAGSGDTLTGIIAGFLAQGYSAIEAAKFGVYIHGLAGDIAVQNSHPNALIASDITSNLGAAFLSIDKL